ncbi:MAG: hypothetical protein GY880_03095 [Planctomycetaceae bacterium]|jgi:hypothetical protein|nr:hypothetical protein [Planctomycetaceae bacterium]
MLLTFMAYDVKTDSRLEFPTAQRDTSYEGWEIDAWKRVVDHWTLPSSVLPIEWFEGHPNEIDNDRFRDQIQQSIESQETNNN